MVLLLLSGHRLNLKYLSDGGKCDGVSSLGEGVDTGSVQCRRGNLGFSGITVLNFVVTAREYD